MAIGLAGRRRTTRTTFVVAAFVAAVFALSACSDSADSQPNVMLTLPNQISSDLLTEGQMVYSDTCAVCHGRDGEGGIGPALIGVAARLSEAEHLDVVYNGRGQMQSFRALLDADEIVQVVAYQRDRFG